MIQIIKAQEHHIPDICKLWLEFMEFSQEFDPVFEPRDGAIPVFGKEYLRPAMKSDNSLVLVAMEGEKVVGYSYSLISELSKLEKRKQYGCVHDLFITANYRRKGIGEKMYNEIINWFHSQDIDRVELHIIANNRAANSFWRKHGFGEFEHTLYRQI